LDLLLDWNAVGSTGLHPHRSGSGGSLCGSCQRNCYGSRTGRSRELERSWYVTSKNRDHC